MGRPSASRSTAPRIAVAATVAVALGIATGTSHAHPDHGDRDPLLGASTLEHTVLGDDQDRVNDPRGDPGAFALLRVGPGEPYVVRNELAAASPERHERRRSLVYLGQLSDFQIADQQSPARVEFLDPAGGPVSSAWRPQETLVPHQVELTIRQLNQFVESPVPDGDGDRARMANAVMTGDLADNQQLNETRWVMELLQGGVFIDGTEVADEIDPGSGSDEVGSYPPECQAAVAAGLLDPDDADRYVGVQRHDDFPGGSTLADKNSFYDPDQPAGAFADWPQLEGLVDKAQEPFGVEGLEVPSYVAFGNHDMLVQGNVWANVAFDRIARGCVKVFPAPGAESVLDDLLGGGGLSLTDSRLLRKALTLAEQPSRAQAPVLESFEALVPPDPDRRLIDRREFKRIFDNGVQADAHGFGLVDGDELAASDGAASYYGLSPADGIRYLVLDTVAYGGVFPFSSAGNIDRPQFEWLERELALAHEREELVLVFAHHATGSLNSPIPDESAPPCRDPVTGADLFELGLVGPGCDRDPRPSAKPGAAFPYQGADLRNLLLEFPNVLALIAGHSHENAVQPFSDGDGGGFWEIKSPAVVDWPAQHRLIEVMDNDDGTLSIFATMLDDASPPRASALDDGDDPSPQSEPLLELDASEVAALTTEELASIGRTLSYNDPQAGPNGRPQGIELDRNVELLLPDPRAEDDPGGGGGDGRPPDGGGGDGGDRSPDRDRGGSGPGGGDQDGDSGASAAEVERSSSLPFTGLALAFLALIAAALLAGGRMTRRLARHGR